MAGSIVAGSGVGSRTLLFETEHLCAERQGGLWHVHSDTSAVETCMDPWIQLFLEASVCLPAHVAGGFALMMNELLLGVDGKADSNYAGLVPSWRCMFSLSLSFSPCTVFPTEQLCCSEAVFFLC